MRHGFAGRLALALVVLLPSICGAAQPPTRDAQTLAALQKMGEYLRSLRAFQLDAVTTDEDVLDDGQKIQYTGSANILARLPDRLRGEVATDGRQRLFLYDGKEFTLYGERVGLYATVPAPPTVAALASHLDSEYGFSVPLADLFRWGAEGWNANGILSALDVGPSEVYGVTCEQYALRQQDVDWQIWVQKGDYPLPRKIVITTRTDEARPQHTAVYTWNLAPSFNEATFKFTPPPGVQRVVLARDTLTGQASGAPTK
jgi:hypothetical protein